MSVVELWAVGADVATIVGVVIALFTLVGIGWQILLGNRISEAQFLLSLKELSLEYSTTSIKFAEGGAWHQSKQCPSSSADIAEVDVYMGFFELCEAMIRNRTIKEDLVLNSFAYKCLNIVRSGAFIEEKLSGREKQYWVLFSAFAERCKKYEEQKGDLSARTASSVG